MRSMITHNPRHSKPEIESRMGLLPMVWRATKATEEYALRFERSLPMGCAPSKLNDPSPVPTTVFKVTHICAVPPRYDAGSHASIVAVVHDALLHETDSSSDVVGVRSIELKFSPESLAEAPPVGATFDGPLPVTVGAVHRSTASRSLRQRAAGRSGRRAHRRS